MNDEGLLAEVGDLPGNSPPQSAFMEQDNDEVLNSDFRFACGTLAA